MRDGDSVVETIHRFDEKVNECLIQAINVKEEDETRVLTTFEKMDKLHGLLFTS